MEYKIVTIGQDISHINGIEVVKVRDYGPSWEYCDYELQYDNIERLGIKWSSIEPEDKDKFLLLGKSKIGKDNGRYDADTIFFYVDKQQP